MAKSTSTTSDNVHKLGGAPDASMDLERVSRHLSTISTMASELGAVNFRRFDVELEDGFFWLLDDLAAQLRAAVDKNLEEWNALVDRKRGAA